MIALTVAKLCKAFGVNPVLEDITFTLAEGRRMGLVGVNGSGKTTLLKLIAGLEDADSGAVSIIRGLSTGYLTQYAVMSEGLSVWREMERVFEPLRLMEGRLRDMEAKMATTADSPEHAQLLRDYSALTDEFERRGAYEANSRIAGVLSGLGFSKARQQGPASVLSGGERTRLGLARILLEAPDILLLDEPTNHLDLDAAAWLEDTLRKYRGTVIVISHDRYFLNAVCDCIALLSMRRLTMYEGDYTSFQARHAEDVERKTREYKLQQDEIARQEAIIARYKMYNTEASHIKARAREKALDRMVRLDKPVEEDKVWFSFDTTRRTGEDVLTARGLAKGFDGRKLFDGVDLDIKSGSRVALIGPNGAGKSTLIKILAGRLDADAGAYYWGANVQSGYYDQHQAGLNPDKSVLDEVWDDFRTLEPYEVRGALALFLLRGEDVFAQVSTLSGGERGRLALTKLMLRRDNVLLLDEPTNHLDMDSREVLEKALTDYPGTIIAVSHDRYFINRTCDHVMELNDGELRVYPGNYDDFVARKAAMASIIEEDTPEAQLTRTELDKQKKRERAAREELKKLRAQVGEAERNVQTAERDMAALEALMADPESYHDPEATARFAKDHARALEDIAALYAKWEALLTEYERARDG